MSRKPDDPGETPAAAAAGSAASPPAVAPTKPAQDEWGLFDPAQCGFPAVLERLEQMAKKQKNK